MIYLLDMPGLNNRAKRNRVRHILLKQKLDIICLQETHIKKDHKRMLIDPKLGIEFIAADEKKKRGVVIYVKSSLEPQLMFTDVEGRTVMLKINYRGAVSYTHLTLPTRVAV